MSNAPPPISVRDLTKKYGGRVAVDRLSFDVAAGTVTGFLGPNGAGKSTAMRLMLGLDRPDSGTAAIMGRAYAALDRPLTVVGALLEAGAVHKGRSARDHLLFLARSQGFPVRRVGEVLELTGLSDVARQRAGGFSLGMGQRLGIAAALLGDPRILVLDEPVNGLDPDGVLWIRTLLTDLARQGRTVLVSSHLMNEMAVTAEHLIVIGRGRLLADCSTREFIERHSERTVRVITPGAPRLAGALSGAGGRVVRDGDTLTVHGLDARHVAELAARERVAVHELTPQHASLEAAFMELTRADVEYRNTSGSAS